MNTTSLASALDSLFGTISTCDSIFAKNGSTKGLISAANLASVLGVGASSKITIATLNPTDLNSQLGINGYYAVYFCAPSSVPSNMPSGFSSGTRFFLEIMNISDYYIVQKIYDTNGKIYSRYRYSTTWTSWKEL